MLLATLSEQGSWALTLYGIGVTAALLFSLWRWVQRPSPLQQERDRYHNDLHACQQQCAQLRQQLDHITRENDSLRSDRNHWHQQYQTLSEQLTALEATYEQLEQQLHRLEQERDRLQEALNHPPDWWQEITKNYQAWWDNLPFLPHEDPGSKS